MSNLVVTKNSKNKIGVGTNVIELTNSQSSALDIKKSDNSYSFLNFDTVGVGSVIVGVPMESTKVVTFKNTVKITTLNQGSLVYLDASGNWTGIGTSVGIGSYLQVNSAGNGLQWTSVAPI